MVVQKETKGNDPYNFTCHACGWHGHRDDFVPFSDGTVLCTECAEAVGTDGWFPKKNERKSPLGDFAWDSIRPEAKVARIKAEGISRLGMLCGVAANGKKEGDKK